MCNIIIWLLEQTYIDNSLCSRTGVYHEHHYD
nr:MAG TPA: hypothetical protein [Caudoviricetes sp.]